MTISTELRKAGPFTGNGVTTAFPFSFKVFAATDVTATRADTLGAETGLVLNTDFTVALNADQDAAPGGTVTLAAPLSTGYRLVVSSAVPNLQPTDITNNGGFYPRVIEDALDRHVAQIQQIDEKVARALKVAITSPLGDQALPSPVAGMLIGWNESSDGLKNYAPIGGTLLGQQLAAANGSSLVGFQQAGSGAVVRTAQDKMREWVSVKDFGAVGDGVVDDGAAFKKALDAAVSLAMPLYVEGTFLLNTWTKYVPAGALEIRGSGGVIKTAGTTSFTSVGGDTTIDGLVFDGWTRVVDVSEAVDIDRFQFSNNIVQNGKCGILWVASGSDQIGYGEAQVFNNTFRDMETDGVYLRPRRMEVTKVTNNTFRDFLSTTDTVNGVVVGLSTASGLKRHMAEISGNTFFNLKLSSDAAAANIYPIMVHEVENYVVSGNNIKNVWKEGLAYATEVRGIHTRAGRGVVIGNTIENVRGTAINIVDSINDAGIDHITQIVNNTISSDDGSAFIGIKVRCQDSTVKGNLIENANIAIQGTHPQYSGTFRTQVYSDNTIRNAHLAGIRVALNRRGLQISNNNISTVDNMVNAAIDPDDFTEVTTAIHIVGTTGGNTQNITLTGNLIQNVTGSALTFENAAGETINGIVATGNMFVSVTSSLFNVVGAVIKALMFKGNSVSVSGSIAPALDNTNVLHLEGNEYRTISASQNEFSTAGENIYVTVSGASSRGITGFANGFSGRRITVFNAGTANNLLLSHESTSSSAENRISSGTGADVTLGLGDCATLVYDATASRWRIVSAFT